MNNIQVCVKPYLFNCYLSLITKNLLPVFTIPDYFLYIFTQGIIPKTSTYIGIVLVNISLTLTASSA